MMALALSWPLQLTYPISRCSVPQRLSHPKERQRFFDAVLEGGIKNACQKMGMARWSVWDYRKNNPDFEAELQKIIDDFYNELAFQAIQIADEAKKNATQGQSFLAQFVGHQVNSRIRVLATRKAPVQVNVDNRKVSVKVNDPERAAAIAKIEESRRRALQEQSRE